MDIELKASFILAFLMIYELSILRAFLGVLSTFGF
jgi:hypothetical protein